MAWPFRRATPISPRRRGSRHGYCRARSAGGGRGSKRGRPGGEGGGGRGGGARAIEGGGRGGEAWGGGAARLAGAVFARIDYVDLRAAEPLEPMAALDRPARLLAAAKLGRTRLIDNLPLTPRAIS